ncbi:MAG: 8-amino-7-oxononanoate synthase [Nitrospiraceae bacterium]|nr:MAG: 8-amino-7-oxononanoate synthase [Nitrospiraceae bacterium]
MKGFEQVKSQKSKVKSLKPESLRAFLFSDELKALRKKNLLRSITTVAPYPDLRIVVDGRRCLNFSSNDYLNLSSHPAIVRAAAGALNTYGFGAGASRLMSGTQIPHRELEERIARFKNTEAALLFNSGYAANTGVIPAIAGSGDEVFSDELNHASIVDGIRLCRAAVNVFRHRDTTHLEDLLKKSPGRGKRRLVITDTVFSMDGDIAPLKDILFLCNRYKAFLMVDDAHGTGVLGNTGRGGLEHFGIRSDTIIQIGTLSKAAGCLGAFVAGEKELIEILINRARSFIYSTALPPAVAAAGKISLDIIDSRSQGLRKRLWKNRERLVRGLAALGFDTLSSETPIVPVLAGNVKDALMLARHLMKCGIFAPAIRPPTVPEDRCRIRFSVTAGQRDEDIDRVLQCMGRYG